MVQVKIVKALYEFIEALATYAFGAFRKAVAKATDKNNKKVAKEQERFNKKLTADYDRHMEALAREKQRHNSFVDKLATAHSDKLYKLDDIRRQLDDIRA